MPVSYIHIDTNVCMHRCGRCCERTIGHPPTFLLSLHPLTAASLSPRLLKRASAPEDPTPSPPPPNLRAGNLINFHCRHGQQAQKQNKPRELGESFHSEGGGRASGESLPVRRGQDADAFKCVSIENVCSCPE